MFSIETMEEWDAASMEDGKFNYLLLFRTFHLFSRPRWSLESASFRYSSYVYRNSFSQNFCIFSVMSWFFIQIFLLYHFLVIWIKPQLTKIRGRTGAKSHHNRVKWNLHVIRNSDSVSLPAVRNQSSSGIVNQHDEHDFEHNHSWWTEIRRRNQQNGLHSWQVCDGRWT